MKSAQNRQKSYGDIRRKELEFLALLPPPLPPSSLHHDHPIISPYSHPPSPPPSCSLTSNVITNPIIYLASPFPPIISSVTSNDCSHLLVGDSNATRYFLLSPSLSLPSPPFFPLLSTSPFAWLKEERQQRCHPILTVKAIKLLPPCLPSPSPLFFSSPFLYWIS